MLHPPHPHDPDTGVRGSLLVMHCLTCSKLGESGGDFAATSLSTNLSDLASPGPSPAWRNAPGPIGLVGHSLGGAACLLATGEWQGSVRWS